MSFISQNLKLPFIAPAQAQKHVTHNEALRALDAIAQLSLVSKNQTTPPTIPIEGSRYFVAVNATDIWANQDGKIAAYQDGAWVFYTPLSGWQAWIEDENVLQIWDGTIWQDATPVSGYQNLEHVGINTSADTTNRLSISSPATLLNHAGNGHQLKLNKNAATDTASLLYQSNWSGRAEIGLAGDDDFHFKVSGNGNTWHEAMTIDGSTGDVSFKTGETIFEGPAHNIIIDVDGSTAFIRTASDAGILSFTGGTSSSNGANIIVYGQNAVTGAGDVLIRSGSQQTNLVSADVHFQYQDTNGTKSLARFFKNFIRLGVDASVDVACGNITPSCKLHVDGPVRVKAYTTTTLPNAGNAGSGAILMVSDEAGGAVLAFSDGANWRRVTDRAVVA